MKRRLLIAAVFLLAGVVVNVAVAWGLDTWNRVQFAKIPKTSKITVPAPAPVFILVQWGRYAVGWPTDALGYTYAWDVRRILAGADSVPHPLDSGVRRVHPLRPIWPGFAVNTLFYAAVFWLLICGPFVPRRLIRHLRRRRGHCPACAYPMGESDTCTECGRELPNRAEVAT